MTFAEWQRRNPQDANKCLGETGLCVLALLLTFAVAAMAIGAMIVFG